MNVVLRAIAYAVLVTGLLIFGDRFLQSYGERFDAAARRYEPSETSVHTANNSANDHAPAPPNRQPVNTETNADVAQPDATLAPGSTNDPPRMDTDMAPSPPARTAAAEKSHERSPLGLDAFLALAAAIGLGLLVARDVSRYVAERSHRSLYDDEGKVTAQPEYERAEAVWANGDYLEAIRLMREIQARNPRQVHVLLRIAEIYEKDMANNLAAALEYEEILKFKLDAERWGWAAIHLCNLYNRLGQTDKADVLLRRIVEEYGTTAAAAKAREHLGLPEGEPPSETASGPATPITPDNPKLPRGFRPKKR